MRRFFWSLRKACIMKVLLSCPPKSYPIVCFVQVVRVYKEGRNVERWSGWSRPDSIRNMDIAKELLGTLLWREAGGSARSQPLLSGQPLLPEVLPRIASDCAGALAQSVFDCARLEIAQEMPKSIVAARGGRREEAANEFRRIAFRWAPLGATQVASRRTPLVPHLACARCASPRLLGQHRPPPCSLHDLSDRSSRAEGCFTALGTGTLAWGSCPGSSPLVVSVIPSWALRRPKLPQTAGRKRRRYSDSVHPHTHTAPWRDCRPTISGGGPNWTMVGRIVRSRPADKLKTAENRAQRYVFGKSSA